MHLKKDELTFLYDSNNTRDLKTLAFASSISNKINKQDLRSGDVSATLFRMMIDRLGGEVKTVINKSVPFYQSDLRDSELSSRMWLSILKQKPELLKAPIAMCKDRIIVCNTPTDIYKLNTEAAASIQILGEK